jgi:hypothetical protein
MFVALNRPPLPRGRARKPLIFRPPVTRRPFATVVSESL